MFKKLYQFYISDLRKRKIIFNSQDLIIKYNFFLYKFIHVFRSRSPPLLISFYKN